MTRPPRLRRYAARQLVNTPLFTGLAILSFGLGIGANPTLYAALCLGMARLMFRQRL